MYFKFSVSFKKKQYPEYKNFYLMNKNIYLHKVLTFQLSYFYHYILNIEFDINLFSNTYKSSYFNFTLLGYTARLMLSDSRKVHQFINEWSE